MDIYPPREGLLPFTQLENNPSRDGYISTPGWIYIQWIRIQLYLDCAETSTPGWIYIPDFLIFFLQCTYFEDCSGGIKNHFITFVY